MYATADNKTKLKNVTKITKPKYAMLIELLPDFEWLTWEQYKGLTSMTQSTYNCKDDNGKYKQNVVSIKKNMSNHLHPTQKPTALMEYLIETYTHEGAGA